MKLFVFPPSPNSLRCQAVANQLGIELELIPVDFGNPAQTEAGFKELYAANPNHKIPTLVDGDYVLWESGAIMLYLSRIQPDNDLVPDNLQDRARMAQWSYWSASHWGVTCTLFIFENVVKKIMNIGAPDPAQLAKAEEEFNRFGTVLNDHLKGRDTLVGNSVTLADHTVASWLVHTEMAGLPLDGFTEIKRWSGGVLGSAAWQQALATIPGA